MLSERGLGINLASIAKNCKLWSKTLRPWQNPKFIANKAISGTINSLYLFDNQYWFQWEQNVSVERSQIAGTVADDPVPYERTYFTGSSKGRPQVTDSSIATASGSIFPANSYDLGIPAPDVAPIASSGEVSDPDIIEESRYIYTFVRIWNGVESEGPPSPASNIIGVTPGDVVTVSGMMTVMPTPEPGSPVWSSNVTHKRLYRVATGIDGAAYQFVGQVSLAEVQYQDEKLTDELGAVLESSTWNPPPDDLHSIVSMPNGMMAGLSGNRLCFCEPYQPHAWPIDYRQGLTYNGVGLAVFGNTVIAATDGKPTVATGVHPSYLSMEKLEIRQACVSRPSIVDMGDYVVYASPDGLVAAGTGIREVLTANHFRKEDWQKYNPSSIKAFNYDGYYIGFYDTGVKQAGFIFDPRDPEIGFIDLDLYATAGYSHLETDALYLVVNGQIVQWDADTTKMQYEWESGVVRAPHPVNPAICQILALEYPFTFKLIGDGVERVTKTVTSSEPFRLPAGYLAEDFKGNFVGSVEIEDVLIGETVEDLKLV